MSQTQTQDATQKDPTRGHWLYNAVMAGIEPELTLDSIGTLDKKYEGESLLDAQARQQRYELAFQEFDRLMKLVQDVNIQEAAEIKKSQHEMLLQKEQHERDQEVGQAEQEIDSLEDES